MRIAVLGCALADLIYTGVAFDGEAMRPLRSREPGDGGVVPGGLVFAEDFQKFVGMSSEDAIAALVGGRRPDHFNVGGPAIVALILAAQLLAEDQIAVDYFGTTGQDETAERIRKAVAENVVKRGEFQGRIRISLGVGYRDETTLSIDALLKMADEAVYAAKRAGRNRVALGSPPRDKGKKSA